MAMNNNDLAGIFGELMSCLCENKMFHHSAASAYRWLSLDGNKRMHMYKSMLYGMKEIKLENIATVLGIRIPEVNYDKIEATSYNFYNSDRINSADENSYKNTVRTVYDTWLRMEQENLDFYNDIWHTLILERKTSKDTALACFVKCLLKDSQCKIKYLTRKIMNYKGINYNPLVIVQEQKCLHKKYKKKLKSVGKMK